MFSSRCADVSSEAEDSDADDDSNDTDDDADAEQPSHKRPRKAAAKKSIDLGESQRHLDALLANKRAPDTLDDLVLSDDPDE